MNLTPRVRVAAGFTLFELLVVLVVLALAAGVIGPRMLGSGPVTLDADARIVLAGLRQAKAEALRRQVPADLVVDIESRTLRAPGAAKPRRLSEGVRVGMVTARTQSSGSESGSLRFYPDGSSTGGRIALGVGENVKLIDVDWLTGRVQVNDAYGDFDDALRASPL